MKKCSKCNAVKQKVDFHKNKVRKDGLSPMCKTCYNTYRRSLGKYEGRSDASIQQKKEGLEVAFLGVTRDTIFKRDNYVCVDCGNRSNLEIHHRDRTSKDINNLVSLCRPCHGIRHARIRKETNGTQVPTLMDR